MSGKTLGSKHQMRADRKYRDEQNSLARKRREKKLMLWLFTVLSFGGRHG